MDNKTSEKRVRKTGFTLIELLVTIAVLSIVFVVGYFAINGLFGKSEDKVSTITKKMILNAAEQYAIEFKDSVDWDKEEIESGEESFCVSLDSLINYGYFKMEDDNINKYRNDYVVKMNVVNGVISYEFVSAEEDNKCIYYKYDSNIVINNSNIKVVEDGKEIGSFNYGVIKLSNNNYETNINLNLDFKITESAPKSPPYITLLVDTSDSMNDNNRFVNAKKAAINLSKDILNVIPNAKISLVTYNYYPVLRRDFKSQVLTDSQFGSATGMTNISGALDFASSMIYNINSSVPKDTSFYTILLFDGIPNFYSFLVYDSSGLNYIYDRYDYNYSCLDSNNLHAADMENSFSDNYHYYFKRASIIPNYVDYRNFESYNNTNDFFGYAFCPINCYNGSIRYWWDGVCSGEYNCKNYVNNSSFHLKTNLKSKLMVVGYDMGDAPDYLKEIASIDTELCSSGLEKQYCYYNSGTSNITTIFEGLSAQIVEKEKSIKADTVTFRIVPAKLANGESLFFIKKNDGSMVEGNKIERVLDLKNLETSQNITIDDLYKFEFNDVVFSECKDNNCSDITLFENIEIELKYEDGSSKKIYIDKPKINVNSTLVKVTN